MNLLDLSDPKVVAELLADGTIWAAPQGFLIRLCGDIASGKTPQPEYVPENWMQYITYLRGQSTAPEESRWETVTADADAEGHAEWQCPLHASTNIVVLTSRTGREYRACKTCYQFEREGDGSVTT
jgi:hypothetical protein